MSRARIKARDARRVEDINAIKTALELAYNYNGVYPDPPGTDAVCLSTCSGESPPSWCNYLLNQMPKIPNDPLSSQQCYLYNSDGTNFRVAAKLETDRDKAQSDSGIYPQFYEAFSNFNQILLTNYKGVWPSAGLTNLDPLYSADELVGWWSFEEGFGTTATDFSSKGNNGTLVNNPNRQIQGCLAGGCISYDGDDYVNIADNDTLDFGTGNFSLEVWVKIPISGSYNWEGILSKGYSTSATANTWGIMRASNNTARVGYQDSTDAGGAFNISFFSSVPLSNGWHHFVVTRSGTTYTFYEDGKPQQPASATAVNLTNTQPLRTASGGNYSQGGLVGTIDEIRVYKGKALSASEVCQRCKLFRSASFCNNCSE